MMNDRYKDPPIFQIEEHSENLRCYHTILATLNEHRVYELFGMKKLNLQIYCFKATVIIRKEKLKLE